MYIVFIIVGIFLIFIGLVVWKLKAVEIIAGYDSEKVIDKYGLGKWVGGNLILMGILVIILGAIVMIVPNIKPSFTIPTYLAIVIGLSVTALIGARKYEK